MCSAVVDEIIKCLGNDTKEENIENWLNTSEFCKSWRFNHFHYSPPMMLFGCGTVLKNWKEELIYVLKNRNSNAEVNDTFCN